MISAQEASARKQRIQDAAYLLFQTKGVENVTYRDVSKQSGISEASIYHYYKNKSLLLLENYKFLWQETLEELREKTVRQGSFVHADGYGQVQCLINALEHVFMRQSDRLKFALECKLYWNRKSAPIDKVEYNRIIAPVTEMFAAAIHKGQKDGSVKLHAECEACSFLLWGVMRAYMEHTVLLDGFYVGENQYKLYIETMKDLLMKYLR